MDIYREEILEHWRSPQNWGTLSDHDLEAEVVNPLCGDQIKVQVKLDTNPQKPYLSSDSEMNRSFYSSIRRREVTSKNVIVSKVSSHSARTIISDIRFSGNGCAISIASASILSQNIKNKPLNQVVKITGEDVLVMLGGPVAPARLKCAFLALEALKRLGDRVKS